MEDLLLYEGKAKKVFKGENGQLILSYKDDATAFNGKKKNTFQGKGRLNNLISSSIFTYLKDQGVSSHFIKRLSDHEQQVYQTTIIPLEIVVRNIATGSLTKRLGIEEGTLFKQPIIELFYKNDDLDDPLINDEHALLLTDATIDELNEIKQQALQINQKLITLFNQINLTLVDFKLEFGRLPDGSIVLSDEISPDTCRLWEKETNRKMDKDVFRQGIDDLVKVYGEILTRLEELGCTK